MDVLKAYIARAAEAQAQTNCLTEGTSFSIRPLGESLMSRDTVLFAESIETARQLDEKFSQTHELVGPLHGVPVSFKDQCKPRTVSLHAPIKLKRVHR
jgi:Asp-tRNA(Asn)/Glu-tRNA(Gln) amidotransferase A subunit family amidase